MLDENFPLDKTFWCLDSGIVFLFFRSAQVSIFALPGGKHASHRATLSTQDPPHPMENWPLNQVRNTVRMTHYSPCVPQCTLCTFFERVLGACMAAASALQASPCDACRHAPVLVCCDVSKEAESAAEAEAWSDVLPSEEVSRIARFLQPRDRLVRCDATRATASLQAAALPTQRSTAGQHLLRWMCCCISDTTDPSKVDLCRSASGRPCWVGGVLFAARQAFHARFAQLLLGLRSGWQGKVWRGSEHFS